MNFPMNIKFLNIFYIATLSIAVVSCSSVTQGKEKEALSSNADALYKKYNLDKINLPPGYKISVYAEVSNARSMALSPAGVVYVGNRSEDKVYAVVDTDKNGEADKVYVLAKDMDTPNGVAFKDGDLYIATINSIYKLPKVESDLSAPAALQLITDKYPSDKHHGWKYIAFGPDGKLYVPVGDPSNISKPDNEIYSTITTLDVATKEIKIYARGIRNTVGFTWHPENKKMWFTDNGRDQLGDDIPGDELNYAPEAGMHFGHPFCLQGNTLDPKFGSGKDCKDYVAPAQVLDPHVAALGMLFYTGAMFDSTYKNMAFIAEHGSWNRSKAIGYRVMTVKTTVDGKASDYKPFADGWLQPDGKVLGRPVDVLQMADGALLVSDDYRGAIYRISKQ